MKTIFCHVASIWTPSLNCLFCSTILPRSLAKHRHATSRTASHEWTMMRKGELRRTGISYVAPQRVLNDARLRNIFERTTLCWHIIDALTYIRRPFISIVSCEQCRAFCQRMSRSDTCVDVICSRYKVIPEEQTASSPTGSASPMILYEVTNMHYYYSHLIHQKVFFCAVQKEKYKLKNTK